MSTIIKRVPDAADPRHFVGLELEFHPPDGRNDAVWQDLPLRAGLQDVMRVDWESVSCNVYGYEATWLLPEVNYRDSVLAGVRALAAAGAYPGHDCGIHVHLDCRPGHTSKNQLTAALEKNRDRLQRLVAGHRKNYHWADRHRYPTIEVRMMESHLDGKRICDWIQALVDIAKECR